MDTEVHHNEWAFLARTDPEVFERRRKRCIEDFLGESHTHRPQLEALQARIDAARQDAPTPLDAVIAITALMCRSAGELATQLGSLHTDLVELKPPTPMTAATLRVGAVRRPAETELRRR